MSLNVYLANEERVRKEAAIVRDWIAYHMFHTNDGLVHEVALEVQVTDFSWRQVAPAQNTGQEVSTVWSNGQAPANFLFANAGVNLGNEIIRNAFLMGYAAYLAQSYIADQKALVIRIIYQHTAEGHTWNHIFDAFWDARTGEFKVKAEKPVQRA